MSTFRGCKMELKQIKELMAAMERTGTKKLSLKEESGFELLLERGEAESQARRLPLFETTETPAFRQDSVQRADAALSKSNEFTTALVAPTVSAAEADIEAA